MQNGQLNVILMSLGVLIILSPYLCGYSLKALNNSPVSESILSIEAQFSYGILVVSTVPLALDTLLDYNQLYDPAKVKLYIFGRVPIVVTGLLMSIQFALIESIPSIFFLTTSRADTYLLCINCFKIIFTGSMMYTLNTIKPEIFSGRLSFLFNLLVCIASILRMLTPGSSTLLYTLKVLLANICLIVYAAILLWWGYKLIKMLRCYTVNDYTCILYMFITFVAICGSYVGAFQSWVKTGRVSDFSTLTPEGLAITNYGYVFLFIMLTIAPGRIARFEFVLSLVSTHSIPYVPTPPLIHIALTPNELFMIALSKTF